VKVLTVFYHNFPV